MHLFLRKPVKISQRTAAITSSEHRKSDHFHVIAIQTRVPDAQGRGDALDVIQAGRGADGFGLGAGDFKAVVMGWVVRGGYHHPADAVEVIDREIEEGGIDHADIDNVERLRGLFEQSAAVFFENDSVDGTKAELAAWSKERMAGFKRPRSYKFIAEHEMPRNATGKVLHRELKKRFTN